jgi:hypothetical protein
MSGTRRHQSDETQSRGIRRVAFGDIFLQDLRTYRERQLAACGLECLFSYETAPQMRPASLNRRR